MLVRSVQESEALSHPECEYEIGMGSTVSQLFMHEKDRQGKKEPSQEKGSMSFNVISSLNSLVNGKLVGLVPINSNSDSVAPTMKGVLLLWTPLPSNSLLQSGCC